jgi:hypothetical protein
MTNRCFVFEIGKPTSLPLKPWKFSSRLMFRCGWLWFAFCMIKMSLFDYEKEIEGGQTEWIK